MINLKGIAIVVGGKNIIPIETKTEATTKSITKKGEEYNHYFMYKDDIIKDFLYDEIKEFIKRF